MRLPSIKYLYSEAGKSLVRFPYTLFCAFIASLIAILAIELELNEGNNEYLNLILVSILGISLTFAVKIFSENQLLGNKEHILQIIAIAFLLLFYFYLPDVDSGYQFFRAYARYAVLFLAVHLFVAFAAFVRKNQINGFWQYNKTLFLRFLMGLIFSGVLYVGLTLALLAIQKLFQVEVYEKLYLYLFIVIAGIFNTWFFVAGIPENIDQLENDRTYPKELKIFCQYILTPLVCLYFLILYAYSIKIIVNWNWPEGVVSYMIMAMAVVGILNLLLLYPYQYLKDNNWVKVFFRLFFILLIPLIIVFFLAIWLRINDYGITENRYYLVVVGMWLIFISLYFSINRSGNIKLIPISLCVVVLLSSFGPWSAFNVSEYSQVKRLEKILLKNDILVNDTIQEAPSDIPHEDTKQIRDILNYLENRHGFEEIQNWFVSAPDSIFLSKDRGRYDNVNLIMNQMGLEYYYGNFMPEYVEYNWYVNTYGSSTLDVFGYNYYIQNAQQFELKEKEYYIIENEEGIYIRKNGYKYLSVDVRPLVRELLEKGYTTYRRDLSKNEVIIYKEKDGVKFKLIFTHLNFLKTNDEIKIENVEVDILIAIN